MLWNSHMTRRKCINGKGLKQSLPEAGWKHNAVQIRAAWHRPTAQWAPLLIIIIIIITIIITILSISQRLYYQPTPRLKYEIISNEKQTDKASQLTFINHVWFHHHDQDEVIQMSSMTKFTDASSSTKIKHLIHSYDCKSKTPEKVAPSFCARLDVGNCRNGGAVGVDQIVVHQHHRGGGRFPCCALS